MSTLDENTNGLQQILNTVNELPSGGGGNKSVIIDVTELPTDIDKNAFYRVTKGTFYYNGFVIGDSVCYVVETRPEISETMTEAGAGIFYYALDTGVVSIYVIDELASNWGVRSGWWTAEEFIELEETYNGIVYDKADMTNDGYYLLLATDLYAGSDKLVKASSSGYPKVLTLDLTHINLSKTTVGFSTQYTNPSDPIMDTIKDIDSYDMVRATIHITYEWGSSDPTFVMPLIKAVDREGEDVSTYYYAHYIEMGDWGGMSYNLQFVPNETSILIDVVEFPSLFQTNS